MARIVVSGYMLRLPLSGNVLACFQYLLGLERLGHSVTYVEESGWPGSSYDPASEMWSAYPAAGLEVAQRLARRHGLDAPICFVDRDTGVTAGATWQALLALLDESDLLLDIGGVCWLADFQRCRKRALVDMDPLFTQIGGFASKVLDSYDVHFSYGTNLGRAGCTVPTVGVQWVPTLPPVVLDMWPLARQKSGAYTTIANWTAYGGIEYEGRWYGQKDREFMRIIDLPSQIDVPLRLALAGAGDDVLEEFQLHGWSAFDAGEVGVELDRYVDFITASRGELSVAKHAYVETGSGWISDRTVCYLASGLPTIVQDTAVECVPTGDGFLTFTSAEEAADRIVAVEAAYEHHAAAARRLAREVFSYRHVLPRLVDVALSGSSRPIHGAVA